MIDEATAWALSPELLGLRDLVRSFVKDEIQPIEGELDPDAFEIPEPQLSRVQAKAKQAGLWCIATPERYGGSGLSLLATCVVAEEAARCRLGLETPAGGAFGFDPPSVVFGGTAEQIERFAVPAVKHGLKTFVALTEPSGGSDPARAIRTMAARSGSEWVINGSKQFISGADEAEWGILFARTEREGGRGGISCFFIETSRPGFLARPIPVIRSWAPCEVTFSDYRVPAGYLLGQEGQGFSLAQKWLGHGRVRYAAQVLGVAAEALEMATRYATQRTAFGGPISEKQGIAWQLVDSEVELRAARLLVYEAAAKGDRGEPFTVEASIAKLYATEAAGRIVDRCIQAFGGLGVSKALPLERWYRELRVKRIGEGPSEVHRMVIARHLFSQVKTR